MFGKKFLDGDVRERVEEILGDIYLGLGAVQKSKNKKMPVIGEYSTKK